MKQIARNDPCPCGSGKKYKKCCMDKKGPTGPVSRKQGTWLLLSVIVVMSLALRFYGFDRPHGLTFDEGLYADLLAEQFKVDPMNYSTQEAYRYQVAQGQRMPKYLDRPLFKHPPFYNYLIALNYRIFGSSHLSAVSVSIIFGSLMIPLVFLLGKEFYDERVGLLAALFLCFDPVHWVCSEKIWMETTMSFFILAAVLFYIYGLKKPEWFLTSGVCAGLAVMTKYPGALALIIIFICAILLDRQVFKQKGFWMLLGSALIICAPWIAWNWRVYGNLDGALITAHQLGFHLDSAVGILKSNVGIMVLIFILSGIAFLLRKKVKLAFEGGMAPEKSVMRNRAVWYIMALIFVLAFALWPLLRDMSWMAVRWNTDIKTGWSNPFTFGPWSFYITRLVELSPIYIFSFLAIPFAFTDNKGDKVLLLSALMILGAFILLGNYQSRYIMSAVPFLLILSARSSLWCYDRLRPERGQEVSGNSAWILLIKLCLAGAMFYFVIKTLHTDIQLAIGPDFGYF